MPPIRITHEVYRHYLETIALQPPETFAILGGYLDDPFCVTDFRFCPPRRLSNGEYDRSAVHINVDHDFMNFVVDWEFIPAGKYMLGLWHSHPPGYCSLTQGDPVSNTGDVAFFSSCLDNDDSPHSNWQYFLAPITTFRSDGSNEITGWILRRGTSTALRSDLVLDRRDFRDGFVVDDLGIEITRDLQVRYVASLAPTSRPTGRRSATK